MNRYIILLIVLFSSFTPLAHADMYHEVSCKGAEPYPLKVSGTKIKSEIVCPELVKEKAFHPIYFCDKLTITDYGFQCTGRGKRFPYFYYFNLVK